MGADRSYWIARSFIMPGGRSGGVLRGRSGQKTPQPVSSALSLRQGQSRVMRSHTASKVISHPILVGQARQPSSPFVLVKPLWAINCVAASFSNPKYLSKSPKGRITLTQGRPMRRRRANPDPDQYQRLLCNKCNLPMWLMRKFPESKHVFQCSICDLGEEGAPQTTPVCS